MWSLLNPVFVFFLLDLLAHCWRVVMEFENIRGMRWLSFFLMLGG